MQTELSKWLEEKKKGETMANIAALLGVDRRSLYKWLHGDPVHPRNAERVSKITGISAGKLVFRNS